MDGSTGPSNDDRPALRSTGLPGGVRAMKIDKTRFLVLTTTIAASATAAMLVTSGCSSTPTSTGDGGTTPGTDSGSETSTEASTDSGPACLDDTGNAPFCGPAGEGGDPPDAGDDAGDAGDGGTADAGPNSPVCQYECTTAAES